MEKVNHNTLESLNGFLFTQLEALSQEDISDENLEKEIKRTNSMLHIADKIIQSGMLEYKVMEHLHEYGIERKEPITLLLGSGNGKV